MLSLIAYLPKPAKIQLEETASFLNRRLEVKVKKLKRKCLRRKGNDNYDARTAVSLFVKPTTNTT